MISIITADSLCQDGNHDCQHICFLSLNNIQNCACKRGYLLTDDGKTCKGANKRISVFLANNPMNKINIFIDHFPCEVFHGLWKQMLKSNANEKNVVKNHNW